jgi:hypothetical protein
MQLGYKTIDPVSDALRLHRKSGKTIIARLSVDMNTLKGLDRVNAAPESVPVMLNLVYDRKDIHPPNMEVYKQAVLAVKKKLKRMPLIVCVENEEIFHGYYEDIAKYIEMVRVNHEVWTPSGVKVSTGGTSMIVAAGMTYSYYKMTAGQQVAEDFRYRYLNHPMGYNGINVDYGLWAIDELYRLQALRLPDLHYPLHFNIRYSTIDFMPEIIAAIDYYRGDIQHTNNELSCMEHDPELIRKAMDFYVKAKVPYVVGYSRYVDDTRAAIDWTEEMENVFLTY